MSTTLVEVVAELERIKKYALEPSYSKLTPDERITQPTDNPVVKRLKVTLDLEDKIREEESYVETRVYNEHEWNLNPADSQVVKRLKTTLKLEDDIKIILTKWGKIDLVKLSDYIQDTNNDLDGRKAEIATILTRWKSPNLVDLSNKIKILTDNTKTILDKWGARDLAKLSDDIQDLTDERNRQKADLNQADYLIEGIIDSKITFTETELEVKPEDNEVIKKLKTFLGRKRTDTGTSTSTDDLSDTMMEGYKTMKNKIRINVLDLDFHNVGKLNASVRIETDPFSVFTRVETDKDGQGEIKKDPMTCEGIMCYGSYDDIKVLGQYNNKDITFAFDSWKIINKGGRNWLYIIYTPNWNFVKVSDVITETVLTMADIEKMEADSEDLEIAINQLKTLTTYKKEAKLRTEALVKDLRTTKATKVWLEKEGAKYRKLIFEFKDEISKKDLKEEELIFRLKDLENKLIKPKMVTTATQTELTMVELSEMENTIKSLSQRVVDYNLVTPKDRSGQDMLFRLEVVERGIASLEEDKQHSETQGQDMRRQLEELNDKVRSGEIGELEILKKKVIVLEETVKRKESDYQKSLRVKEEEWQKMKSELLIDFDKKTEEEKKIVSKQVSKITILENEVKDRLEELRIANLEKEKVECELKRMKEVDFEKWKKEVFDKNKTIDEKQLELETLVEEKSYFLSDLYSYRNFVILNLQVKAGDEEVDFTGLVKRHTYFRPVWNFTFDFDFFKSPQSDPVLSNFFDKTRCLTMKIFSPNEKVEQQSLMPASFSIRHHQDVWGVWRKYFSVFLRVGTSFGFFNGLEAKFSNKYSKVVNVPPSFTLTPLFGSEEHVDEKTVFLSTLNEIRANFFF